MFNVFKYEFKMLRNSLLIWATTYFSIIFMMMVFYPTFSADVAMVDKIMKNYPEELLKAFGMSSGLSLATLLGFFSFTFALTQLFIAIQAANYGFSILSVEEREFTADFLMSKPVSRKAILIAKSSAALLGLWLSFLFIWISSYMAMEIFKEGSAYDVSAFNTLIVSTLFFQLFFFSTGLVISVILRKVRSVLSFSLGLAFGMYILNAMRAIVGGEVLGVLTPFYHFEPGRILETGKIHWSMALISISIILISCLTTIVLYTKRDIHSL